MLLTQVASHPSSCRHTEMSPLEIATLAIALISLTLGIRSELRARSHDRIRLRVIPKIAMPVGTMPDRRACLAFEIINDGFRPVTLGEVGLYFKGTSERGVITVPILAGQERWPVRLEPHSSTTVYTDPSELANPNLRQLDCAYVMTATDEVFRGTSPALQHLAKHGTLPTPRRTLARSGMPGYITVADFSDGF